MTDLQQRIAWLSDADVARLTIWLLNEERRSAGGIIAETTLSELKRETFAPSLDQLLKDLGIHTLRERPDDLALVQTFRSLVERYAESRPEAVTRLLDGLGMEAGGEFALADILANIDIPQVLLIVVLLSTRFRIKYKNKNTEIEFELTPPKGSVKEFLRSLPIFRLKGNSS
ncbi:MAG: hypothetical protein ABII79_06530 [bacterium]